MTLSCLFFLRKWWNLNAEKQVMLRSTQSAKKHVLLWHYHAYFFLWKWWNLNAEKQVMLRSTKSAEKHVLLWHDDFFLMEMAKLTWNAEKQIMLRSKFFLLKSMFCCDMKFFDGKKTWIIDVWLGNIQETPKLELKGMADLFFVYIYMTPWKRFLVVFFCADKQYFAEKQLLCWEALKNKPNSKCHEYHLSNHSMSPTPGMLNKNFKICFNCRFNLHDMNPCRIQSCNYWIL